MTPAQTLEWLAKEHFDQCREERPIQDWIRKMKSQLPEQEPVAWIYKSEPYFDGNKWHDLFEVTTSKQVALWKDKTAKPLYTTPYVATPRPQRKPLTDEQLTNIITALCNTDDGTCDTRVMCRAIEAAHGIRSDEL